ncbi:hypothetical protein GPECTOR_4g610 [Gonium pectorale]|uniref:EF-hand domain-containing protein n=1 Tax=Gonium pectorale TaxID=33097 RepID=A0A150GXK7_GONPE|nr:hypothetical protein GPECTOR_4g610 [Gonium pectorale]|eukprot:KXZ54545.1 hypothetical protein GPECTOR_4g610 [Gonium pectorale]
MAFLSRLASGIKEGLVSLGGNEPVLRKSETAPRASLQKQSSRGKRPTSVSLGILEAHIRDAIACFVQEKFAKGEAKPHVFTQFWLQFPKLEAGFEVLRAQLEARTGSREGPLPLALLQSSPGDFGLADCPGVVQDLCSKAIAHKCGEIDFVGLVMLLLVVHLTEPPSACPHLHPEVHTMLCCLELAFTHFNSARKGKLDKREVAEALQYESAKAHTREGRSGRTSNRLAQRLFEGLDWEYDNTITFENFLRGILQLVSDEFGDDEGDDEPEGIPGVGRRHASCTSHDSLVGGSCHSPRDGRSSATGEPDLRPGTGTGRRPRSVSATGHGSVAPVASSGPPPPAPAYSRTGSASSNFLRNFLRKPDEGSRG